MIFADRKEAGKMLAREIYKFKPENPIVLVLPRGGVPVGFEIARKLQCPLEVLVVRKIGAPGQEELAVGAIGEMDIQTLNLDLIKNLNLNRKKMEKIIVKEKEELKRRIKIYRKGKKILPLEGFTAILVDDGLATGATARVAIQVLTKLKPKRIIFAVPICSADVKREIKKDVNDLICLFVPQELFAIGNWYEDFSQLTDNQIIETLDKSRKIFSGNKI